MRISCATYSYVAEPLGYPGEVDSRAAEAAALEMDVLPFVDNVLRRLDHGLDGLEFWFAQVAPRIFTPSLASEVRSRLAAAAVECPACGGSLGNPRKDPDSTESFFNVASLLGASLIVGDVAPDALTELGALCSRYRIRFAYENHPEASGAEMLAVIDRGDEWIGLALDTGSLAQQGGDPASVVRQLGDRLLHVHVRDVPSVGSSLSVPIGSGIVDVPGVIRELVRAGYDAWVSVEIPATTHDPSPDIVAAATTIRHLWDRVDHGDPCGR